MAGNASRNLDKAPAPTAITLHEATRVLEIGFDSGEVFRLPFEFLRVHSPSAEVQGHGPGQETLQTGKRQVGITSLQAVGHYAIQPSFSDGHDTGIFSWDYLYRLGTEQDQRWQGYLQRLAAAGAERDATMVKAGAGGADGGSCGSHGHKH